MTVELTHIVPHLRELPETRKEKALETVWKLDGTKAFEGGWLESRVGSCCRG